MSVPEFLDTNILVYAYDPTNTRKQRIARDLMRRAIGEGFVVSSQVIAEFISTMLHQMSPPALAEEILNALDVLEEIPAVRPDAAMMRRAIEVQSRYRINFWDAMIVAAAERSGCARIWSEDLNGGQEYFGIKVENPFGPDA
jgi:predicted nucleic acid-binding protein